MASLKILLFDVPSKQLSDGSFPVTLRVTHQRKRKYFSLDRRCLPSQWDAKKCRFRRSFPDYKIENSVLDHVEARAKQIMLDFEREGVPFSLRKFEEAFLQKEESYNLISYFDHWIKIKEEEKKFSTASQYFSARNALVEYRGKGKDIHFSDVDSKFLHGFERWLRAHRQCRDTSISVYMRAIRTIFNRAIKEDKYHRRKTLLRKVNHYIAEIAEMVGIDNFKVTTYVGRHTYATTLKNAGISVAVISEALGHESERVTQIYLKQFDDDELDRADLEAL